MDEKTLEALTALANKLGTTAEYLWGVLLRQAPISGAIDLAVMIALIAAAVLWCRFVVRKTSHDADGYADWREEAAFFSWASAVVACMLTALILANSAATIAAALFNPEYWALRQILK